jgi:hypothetical protein
MAPDIQPLGDALGPDRRTFVKRMVIGTVFAAPIVSSFTMAGVGSVFGGSAGATVAAANTSNPPTGFSGFIRRANTTPQGELPAAQFTDNSTSPMMVGNVVSGPNTIFPTPVREVILYRGDSGFLTGQLATGYTYLYGVAVVWQGPDAFEPGVTLQLFHPSFQDGDEVFLVNPDGTLSPHGATVINGTVTIVFTEDPGFVIARAPEAPPNGGDAVAATPTAVDPTFTG